MLKGRFSELVENDLEIPLQRLENELDYMIDRIEAGADEHGTANVNTGAMRLAQELRQEYTDVGFYTRELQAILLPQPGQPRRVYVCGPYSHNERHRVANNIEIARQATAVLMLAGHYPFTPHMLSANFDVLHPEIQYDNYLEMYKHWLKLCHGIFLLPGWATSKGATEEYNAACCWGLDVYHSLAEIPPVNGYPIAVEEATRLGYFDGCVVDPTCQEEGLATISLEST